MSSVAATFNAASNEYESQLLQGLSLSGEDVGYFVDGRIARVVEKLKYCDASPNRILDFGCGVGNASSGLGVRIGAKEVVGYDCSDDSLQVARSRTVAKSASGLKQPEHSLEVLFTSDPEQLEPDSFDLAYTSGVFHHIPVEQRHVELKRIYASLRPQGYLAFFENNPWNPATHLVMSKIPFDRDAICLSILEAKHRLRSAGFRIESVETLFYFPRSLSCFRPLESALRFLPFGTQYLIWASKRAKD